MVTRKGYPLRKVSHRRRRLLGEFAEGGSVEHTGKIWFGEDDQDAATQASVVVESDDRLVVRVGDSLVADWALIDVDISDESDPVELRVGDVSLLFAPDDPESWNNEVAAVRLRVRLLNAGAASDASTAVETAADGEADDGIVMTYDIQDTAVPAPGSYCRACGSPIDPRAEICVNCGVRQYAVRVRPHKSRTTAALLALFLGGIGAHHFYLGHTGLGILYLLFFWTLIPAMVAFVEGLVFLFSSDASFDAKYNRY